VKVLLKICNIARAREGLGQPWELSNQLLLSNEITESSLEKHQFLHKTMSCLPLREAAALVPEATTVPADKKRSIHYHTTTKTPVPWLYP
jgi:hypothetical protein